MRIYLTSLIYLCLLMLFQSCAGGQAELVSLAQESQREALACREKLTEAKVSARVANERAEKNAQSLDALERRSAKQLSLLSQQLELALGELKPSEQSRLSPQVDQQERSIQNLRELDHQQLISFVSQAGGRAKRIGRHLMAVFGEIKTQIIYNPKDHVLTAHARFKGYKNDLVFINEWNRTKRFSRAYIDKDHDIVLEAEIDIEPGQSSEAIRSWLKGFGLVLNFFQHSLMKGSSGLGEQPSKEAVRRHRI